jgi:hypothetical protein
MKYNQFFLSKQIEDKLIANFLSDLLNTKVAIIETLESEDLVCITLLSYEGDFKQGLHFSIKENFYLQMTDIEIAKQIARKFEISVLLETDKTKYNSDYSIVASNGDETTVDINDDSDKILIKYK